MNAHLRLKFLWILAFISSLTFVWQDVELLSTSPIQISIIHKIISHFIIGIILFFQVVKRPKIISDKFIIHLIILFFWYSATSIWSIYPLWTLYRSFEYLIFILLAGYSIHSFKDNLAIKEWVNMIWLWIGILILSVWINLILFPDQVIQNVNSIVPIMIHSVYPRLNANTISHLSGILAIIACSRFLWEKRKVYIILFMMAITTMILSQGRSGLISFVFSFLVLLMLYRKVGIILGVIILIIGMITMTQVETYFFEFFKRGQNIETLYSLGGRIYKWEFAYEYIKQNPFLGYGAFAGSRFEIMPEITGTLSSSTHSAWVELIVDAGVIGFIIFLLLVVRVLFRLLRKAIIFPKGQRELFIEATAVFLLIFIRSFFTTATLITPYDFSFWVGIILASRNYAL
jgi:O-antigen ligase